MALDSDQLRVVICGGGIIGCSTAFYLTQAGVAHVTVIERSGIACHASGKAGGFLAVDWCDDGPLGPLARHSFALHQKLSHDFAPKDIGYRRMTAHSIQVDDRRQNHGSGSGRSTAPEWLETSHVKKCNLLGSSDTCAQVHPFKLTTALMEEACIKGATVVTGVVHEVLHEHGQVSGVRLLNSDVISADAVVIALGPWSSLAQKWLPGSALPVISAQRAHSIIMEGCTQSIGPDALFLNYIDASGKSKEPEVYPRPDGTVYVCGESDSVELPEDVSGIIPSAQACDTLARIATRLCSALSLASLTHRQACYLPCSPDGLPLIGCIPNYKGAYIATGHSCWGILNGPATGQAIASLILSRQLPVDITAFDPGRFSRATAT